MRTIHVVPEWHTAYSFAGTIAFNYWTDDTSSVISLSWKRSLYVYVPPLTCTNNKHFMEQFSFECRKVIGLHFPRHTIGLKTSSSNQKHNQNQLWLPWVLIGSLYCPCPLWLARVINLSFDWFSVLCDLLGWLAWVLIGSLYCLHPCDWLEWLIWVLIGSLHCPFSLRLVRAINVVLVSRHSIENHSINNILIKWLHFQPKILYKQNRCLT